MSKIKNQIDRKIFVSNPGKQYTHQLLHALEKNNILYRFFTSFWFKPANFPFIIIKLFPSLLREKIEVIFRKRFFEKISENNIVTFPFFELLRELTDKLFGQRFAERMQFLRDRIHDRWAALRLNKTYSIVVGYEESCMYTFRKAKKLGLTTILDLAQIHYKDIEEIADLYPVFGSLFKNKNLRNRINKIKSEELALADFIICLSDFAKQSLICNGIDPQKIFVIHLGFDPEKFIEKKQYFTQGKLKVIFTGTLTIRKGIDTLLETFNDHDDKFELTLVGPMADAKSLIEKHNNIRVFPYLDHIKLNKLLSESDLFVFPSYLDSWAMVVIEAMASGLPVIVSKNTGSKEAVNANSGFVIETGNKEALSEKIFYFYNNPTTLEKMGKNARKQAMNYTWDTYHQNIVNIISRVKENNETR